MGIDVQIWARGKLTPEQVAACRARFEERLPGFLYSPPWADGELVTLDTMVRYYGPGYERGDWPTIYAAIVLMRESFPDAVVSYSGDEWDDDNDYPATDERMREIWRHWCGPHGDDYRNPKPEG